MIQKKNIVIEFHSETRVDTFRFFFGTENSYILSGIPRITHSRFAILIPNS